MTIIEAITDTKLFAPWFRDRDTWASWMAFLAALFALPMTPVQFETYRQCTGRTRPPTVPSSEGWLLCGRRAGKSFVLALVAVFLAAFKDHRPYLAPGERATILIIAADRKQARVILRYVSAFLTRIPMLRVMIEKERAEAFDLNNAVTIEVGTASFRTVRGYTFAAVLADELAFWATDDAAEPDYAILDAVRPGMATIPGAMLLCASSPYARKGALHDAHKKHFGKDGDPILVWQAATLTMNPTVPQSVIDAAYERDPSNAAAEYGAQFRSDVETFVSREAVEACVELGTFERPPVSGIRYFAFVDPSGGTSDSMTLAIAHADADGAVIVDALRERPAPFSPEQVVEEFADTIRTYGLSRVRGDRYGGEFCREPFRRRGIQYELSEKPKSDLYRDMLPALNSGQVVLLDSNRIVNQLCNLERRTARGGRDSIDHAPGSHDDLANVIAGVVSLAAKPSGTMRTGSIGVDGRITWHDDKPRQRSWSRTPGISADTGERRKPTPHRSPIRLHRN